MSTAKCLSPMTEEIHTAVGVELAVFVPGDEGYGLLTATPGLQDFPELREFTPDAAPAGPAGGDWAHSFLPGVRYDRQELAVVAIYQSTAEYQRMFTQHSLQVVHVLALGGVVCS